MASSLRFSLVFFFFINYSSAFLIPGSPNPMVLPVTRDASTLQYLTWIFLGSNRPASVKVVLDLGGPFVWLSCPSSFQSLRCLSLQCSRATANSSCFSSGTCSLRTVNSVTGVGSLGYLAEDTLAVGSISDSIVAVDRFLFSCAPPRLLTGLASHAQGILGLGRGRVSLPSQLAGNRRRFALCLSSAAGAIIAGDRPETSSSGENPVWDSLTYTPLVPNPDGEYYIKIKSVKVNGRRLSLDLSTHLIAKLSTIVPYSTVESSIYDTLVKAYAKAAAAANLTQVAAVPPFGVCFRETPVVPEIELVLQSEMVKWRIFGRNLMVRASEGVMCLGVLDGGVKNNGVSVVLGGYQLEDNLLEFDLGSSTLGFGSLSKTQTSCADFRLGTIAGDESA